MKNNKRITSIVFILATMLSSGLFAKHIEFDKDYLSSNTIIKQDRELSSFNEIYISSALDVVLSQGEKEMVMVEAPENIIEKIITEVKGDALYLKVAPNTKGLKDVKLTVFFKDLKAMKVSGAVDVGNLGSMTFKMIKISISGASDVKFNILADELALSLSGASEFKISGKAEKAKISVNGASEMKALDFVIKEAMVEVSGASEVTINATESLAVKISGASTVTYKDGPPKFKSHVTGGGSLRKI